MPQEIPVTLLTGYLGAGKTTLINHVIAGTPGKRYALIVNEFAEIGIDADLIARREEDLIEFTSGCVCCSLRHELAPTITRLAREGAYDAMFIETTGLASPQPIMLSFATDPAIRQVARLNSVVTLVDARTLEARLDDAAVAREQLLFADHVLLNKADLVDTASLDAAEARIRSLNPIASIHRTTRAQTPIDPIMAPITRLDDMHEGMREDHAHHDGHGAHENAITSVSLSSARPLDLRAATTWLDQLLLERGGDILRAKGIFNGAGEDSRIILQIVSGLLDGDVGAPWRAQDERRSRLVFIGRNLDAKHLKAGFEGTLL